MPSFILIHPTVWPQCTNVRDRQTAFDKHTVVAVEAGRTQDGCYGGYIALDCGTQVIGILNETYGRQPQQFCSPSPSGTDCSVEGSFYRDLCNGQTSCRHLGIGFRYINRPGCVDVYTNYVRIVYSCYTPIGRLTVNVNVRGGGAFTLYTPARELIPCVSKFCLDKWQDKSIWDCCKGNKLHSIYPHGWHCRA